MPTTYHPSTRSYRSDRATWRGWLIAAIVWALVYWLAAGSV